MPETKSIKETVPGLGRIIQKFWPQIRQQNLLIVISFLALIAETVFRLLEPWPLKIIFDYILLSGFESASQVFPMIRNLTTIELLTAISLAIVAIAALRAGCAYISTIGMALAATHIMTEIRGTLYSHLQRLSLSFHSKAKSGDLITRVTYDVERIREATVTAALPLFTNVFTLTGMMGVMLWMNWELAIIAIAVFPLFIIVSAHLSKQIQKVARKQRKREGAMAATAAEAMGAIKVVQALSLQGMLESSFDKNNQKSLQEGAESQKLSAGLERTVEMLVAVATALILWRGVQLVLDKMVTPGELLVFINYLKTAFKPMRQLAKYTAQISKATASGERIIDLLDTVPEIRDSRGAVTAPRFRGAVEFKNVMFAYETEKRFCKT